MKIIGRGSLAPAFALAAILGASTVASAQQSPANQHQQNAPTQQTTPAQPGPGMGHEMMRDGMEHGKMGQQTGRKGMEGEHRMGSGMKQGGSAPSSDSTVTTGTNPSTAPSSDSK